jgi:hypothetical protein
MVKAELSRRTRVGPYEGYAKRTMERALAATRKRHAHRIASSPNAQGTEFRNDADTEFRNDELDRVARQNKTYISVS